MAKKKKGASVLTEAQLLKKYPKSGRASIISLPEEKVLRLPSRSIALNYQLNGGIPYGKILELFGEESTGKSLLAMDFGFVCQQLDGEVIWSDVENAFNAHWFEKNGLNLDKVHLLTETSAMEIHSDWVQDTIISIRSRLTKNQPILFVLDSLAAVRCLNEVGESQVDAKAKFGNRAKAISDFLGNRNELFAKAGVCVILINQVRRKIGATKFEDPDKTVGGDATKFYAAQRLNVIRGKQITRKVNGFEKKVGQNVYIRTKKDKTGPPRMTTPTKVYFSGNKTIPVGFDRYAGLPDALLQTKTLAKKKGSSRYYLKDKMVCNGEDALVDKLREDNELRKKLIGLSPINTISKTSAKISSLKSNLYQL